MKQSEVRGVFIALMAAMHSLGVSADEVAEAIETGLNILQEKEGKTKCYCHEE